MEGVNPLHPAQHPLYNSVVLATLFGKLCPVEDLPKCRLVCRLWYNESLDAFRSARTLNFTRRDLFFNSTRSKSPLGTGSSLQQFQNFVEDPSSKCIKTPYRKLQLQDWELLLGRNGKFCDPVMERFLWGPTLGSHITTLTLRNCNFRGVKEFQLIIYKFCPALQSLNYWSKSFEQKCWRETRTYQEPEYGEQLNLKSIQVNFVGPLPVSWLELFSHFPSLRHVGIKAYYASDIRQVVEAIRVIKMQDAGKLPITEFDVAPHIRISGDPESLRMSDILAEYKIPTKKVQFVLEKSPKSIIITREQVQNLIERHASSLTSIDVMSFLREHWMFPLEVPLNKLETFSICSAEEPFPDMEFLKYTPNLSSLTLLPRSISMVPANLRFLPPAQMISNTLDTEGMACFQLLKMKELKIGYELGEEDLSRLVKWLPNLQILEMGLNDDQFGIVCKHWTKLTELVVLGSELTDTGVVGGPVDNPAVESGEEIEAQPNVTSLEDLTCFKAKDCYRITDASVVNGFLKMRKMNRLQLPDVTDRSKSALKRNGIRLEPVDRRGRRN